MSEEKDMSSWADTGNMNGEQSTSNTTDIDFLNEILEDQDFDARRAVDLMIKFMTPSGGR